MVITLDTGGLNTLLLHNTSKQGTLTANMDVMIIDELQSRDLSLCKMRKQVYESPGNIVPFENEPNDRFRVNPARIPCMQHHLLKCPNNDISMNY